MTQEQSKVYCHNCRYQIFPDKQLPNLDACFWSKNFPGNLIQTYGPLPTCNESNPDNLCQNYKQKGFFKRHNVKHHFWMFWHKFFKPW